MAAREIGEPIEERQRALLIRLHGEAQPVPAGKPGRRGERRHEIERKIEALGLLGVDGEADPGRRRLARERQEARGQLGQDARALRFLEARMERRQLHGQAGRRAHIVARDARADRGDRRAIAREIALGIGGGARRLAQHVVGMAISFALGRTRARQGFLDGAAHDELARQDADRSGHGLAHHRLARARDEAVQHRAPIVLVRLLHEPARQHQRPGRGVDEERLRMAEMARPIGWRELVADEAVDGGVIGDAQERLGEAEECDPLLRGEAVFRQEHVDAAGAVAALPRLGHELSRRAFDPALERGRDRRRLETARDGSGLVLAIGRAHGLAQRIGRRRGLGKDPAHVAQSRWKSLARPGGAGLRGMALAQLTKRLGDGVGMAACMLNVVADRLAVFAQIDDDIVVDNAIVDGLPRPQLDVEAVGGRIVFEDGVHPAKSLSLNTLWTVSPSASVTTRI